MGLRGAFESLRWAGNIGAVVALAVWVGACGDSSGQGDAGRASSDAGTADRGGLGIGDLGPGTDLASADTDIRLDAALIPDAPIGPDGAADVPASAPDAPMNAGQDTANDGDNGGKADGSSEDASVGDTLEVDAGALTSCPDGGTCPCRDDRDCPLYYGCFIDATISGCPSTPIGVCLHKSPSNCVLHPNPCDCMLSNGCGEIAGTSCNFFRATDAGGGSCYGCLANP